jgi:dTDP-4-amino-4,6-dideoxygalactose transaminase
MIQFNIPPHVGMENEYIKQAIAAHKICGDGEFTKKCNDWLEKRFNAQKVLLTTSGTTTLDMAALLCDIKPGDEVILPSYTFSSTATAFVLAGAKLVFVDISPDTMNIDENKIEAAITDKTRVIVPVHYAGVACEMDKIMGIAREHNLKVVEDAAQGVMSQYTLKGEDLRDKNFVYVYYEHIGMLDSTRELLESNGFYESANDEYLKVRTFMR